jgi:hypothetical protein
MATALLRRPVGVLLAMLLPLLVVGGTAGAAHAEDGYRYWNYFHATDGAWAFSDKGVGQYVPDDGALEGFRFGTSTASKGIEPRVDPATVTFDSICTDPAPEGKKRVALVLDFGTEADADGAGIPKPEALCAVAAEDATTLQALDAATDVRAGEGMLCGIEGYPADGCGDPVKNASVPTDEQTVDIALPSDAEAQSPQQSQQQDDNGTTWPLVGIVAAVVVIGGAALALNRRRATV